MTQSFSYFFAVPDAFIFIGKFTDNLAHRHYALQISIALHAPFVLHFGEVQQLHEFCAIQPNVEHRFDCQDENQMIMLINPASVLGHYLHHHQLSDLISCFANEWSVRMKNLGISLLERQFSVPEFLDEANEVTSRFAQACQQEDHQTDSRILKALQYMESDRGKVFSLKEVAEKVCLSEGRFIHLFKEQTGMTFRRMQQWHKLHHALQLYFRDPGLSLTELALTCGFSDSAHFSRIFKENFGLTPSVIIQKKSGSPPE